MLSCWFEFAATGAAALKVDGALKTDCFTYNFEIKELWVGGGTKACMFTSGLVVKFESFEEFIFGVWGSKFGVWGAMFRSFWASASILTFSSNDLSGETSFLLSFAPSLPPITKSCNSISFSLFISNSFVLHAKNFDRFPPTTIQLRQFRQLVEHLRCIHTWSLF